MALNSPHFFDIDTISPKSNWVTHPDPGMLGETLYMYDTCTGQLSKAAHRACSDLTLIGQRLKPLDCPSVPHLIQPYVSTAP